MFECCSLNSSHPLLSHLCLQVCSLCLLLSDFHFTVHPATNILTFPPVWFIYSHACVTGLATPTGRYWPCRHHCGHSGLRGPAALAGSRPCVCGHCCSWRMPVCRCSCHLSICCRHHHWHHCQRPRPQGVKVAQWPIAKRG